MTRALAATLMACCLGACREAPKKQEAPPAVKAAPPTPAPAETASAVTHVEMHNVIVHEDENFKLQVRWLRGELLAARAGVIPSFDDKTSLLFQVEAGLVSASTTDIASLLNRRVLAYPGSPLTNVSLATQGEQIRLNGTLHKGVSLPIGMTADLSATEDGRIRVHPVKLSALHIPLKALLKGFGVHVADLIDPKGAKGITVAGDDIILNLEEMIPAPRQRGHITAVHVRGNEIVEVYGSPRAEVVRARQWKNFISCQGGTLRFGKLTMRETDLTMIDTSPETWFDFFLDHYQEQLRAGYIKMNARQGLEVYMQDYGRLGRH